MSSSSRPHTLSDAAPREDPTLPYHRRHDKDAILIDNGSYLLRAGWSADPRPHLVFDNHVARPRTKADESLPHAVGNDITSWHLSRFLIKRPVESGVVVHFESMETVLDSVFTKLGITTDHVRHPVVLTEAICAPQFSRHTVAEMLFETYGVPQLAIGSDALFAGRAHYPHSRTCLIISSGSHATYVIPVVHGAVDEPNIKRIDVGGAHCVGNLQRVLSLKHPLLRAFITPRRVEEIISRFCRTATDYAEEMTRWSDSAYSVQNVISIQLPFDPAAAIVTERSDAEKEEQRKAASKRMQDMQARREQLAIDRLQSRLAELKEIEKQLLEGGRSADHGDDDEDEEEVGAVDRAQFDLNDYGFADEESFYSDLESTTAKLQRMLNKRAGIVDPEPPAAPPKELDFSLINVPNDQLTPQQIKEKHKQLFLKSTTEGRAKARQQREHERALQAEEEHKDAELRDANLPAWLAALRAEKKAITDRQIARQNRKAQLSDRRSAVAKQRMRLLVQQAQDGSGKRPRGKAPDDDSESDDGFGANDDDWAVYRTIVCVLLSISQYHDLAFSFRPRKMTPTSR